MSRWICLVALASSLLLTTAGPALAFDNEPPGFRGIPWGANIKDVKDEMELIKIDLNNPEGYSWETHPTEDSGLRVFSKGDDIISYYRPDEKLTLGRAEIKSILYTFYQDRFFRVFVKYKEPWNYQSLREQLTDVYGKGVERQDDHETWWWFGDKVSVGLTYGIFARGGSVSWIYLPIQRERENAFEEAARTGDKDF